MSAIYPSLEGKVVVITGGAEGIAAAAAESFYRQGSKVIILDISKSSAEALIDRLKTEKESTGSQSSKLTIPKFCITGKTD